jgi:hypothetical protein
MLAKTSKARGTRRSKITIVCVVMARSPLEAIADHSWIRSKRLCTLLVRKSIAIVRPHCRRCAPEATRFTRCCLIHLSSHEARLCSTDNFLVGAYSPVVGS